jgi:hypothetical protein
MDGIVKINPGDEIECDRAKLTEDAALVRVNGAWIELRPPRHDPMTERLIALGRQVDKDMAAASIDKCNCMVRYAHMETQLPAIRKGKEFFTPEGDAIKAPESFEDMKPRAIVELMRSRGDEYIGHRFKAFVP